eukprot:gene20880-7762_t
MADNPENRTYLEHHRMWVLAEVVTKAVIEAKSDDPVAVIIKALEHELQ